MESNNKEGKEVKMDGIGESFNGEEKRGMLPLEKIAKIQEALKPLGYVIEGFQNEERTNCDFILYLTRRFAFRKNPAIPSEVNNIAGVVHNPDNGFQGGK